MLTDAVAIGLKLIDRILPNAEAKQAAQLELLRAQQAGELAELNAELERTRQQTAVNAIEAAHPDRFVAGWRPAIGWVCASALAWHYIGRPVAVWLAGMAGSTAAVPAVELGDLLVILGGILGLGHYRTREKLSGVTK